MPRLLSTRERRKRAARRCRPSRLTVESAAIVTFRSNEVRRKTWPAASVKVRQSATDICVGAEMRNLFSSGRTKCFICIGSL
jgi:hypothetical protein